MKILGVLLAVVVLLTGCGSSGGKGDLTDQVSSSGKYQGFGEDPPLPRPSFVLTDTTGASYDFAAKTAGAPTLLFFGYTQCPDVCPTTMADIGNALRAEPASLQKKVRVVFVTTDVKDDTGPVIRSWLQHFDTGLPNQFVGLTGTQEQIDAAQAAAKVTLAEDSGKMHSAMVRLYGPDDYNRVTFAQSTNLQQQVTHDLKVVAGD